MMKNFRLNNLFVLLFAVMGDFFAFVNDPWLTGDGKEFIPMNVDTESIEMISTPPPVVSDAKVAFDEIANSVSNVDNIVKPLNDLHKRMVHFTVVLIHRLEATDKNAGEMFALAIDCNPSNIVVEKLDSEKFRVCFFKNKDDEYAQHSFETTEMYYIYLLQVIAKISSSQVEFMNMLTGALKNLPSNDKYLTEVHTYLKKYERFIARSEKLLTKAEKVLCGSAPSQ